MYSSIVIGLLKIWFDFIVKEILISSMKKKVELLKEQESEINEEMKQNDLLGKRVAEEVKGKTSGTEYSKYELFVGELNNIIGLLLSLTQRMHRYEVLLQDIDLAEENGRDKRVRPYIVLLIRRMFDYSSLQVRGCPAGSR